MSDYAAPVKDITFALNQLAGLGEVCDLPHFEESSEELVAAVLDEAAKFATGVLALLNVVGDLNGAKYEDNAVQKTEGFAQAYRQCGASGSGAHPRSTRGHKRYFLICGT